MTPERKSRLTALAAAHATWEQAWLASIVPDPDTAKRFGGDYNLHDLDVTPPPGAEEAFQALAAPAVQATRRRRKR